MTHALPSPRSGEKEERKKVIPARKTALILIVGLIFARRRTGAMIAGEQVRRPSYRASRWSAGRRSVRAAGLANLPSQDARASGWASQTHPRRRAGCPDRKGHPKGAVAQRPGASRRSISLFGGDGNRDRATRALSETGGGALAFPLPACGTRAMTKPACHASVTLRS